MTSQQTETHDAQLERSLSFYRRALGLQPVRTVKLNAGRCVMRYLTQDDGGRQQIEMVRNFCPDAAHPSRTCRKLAYVVPDLYAACQRLMEHGAAMVRLPRDGFMAVASYHHGVEAELLQDGRPLAPAEPWISMAERHH